MTGHQNDDRGRPQPYPVVGGLCRGRGCRGRRRASWIAHVPHGGTALAIILVWSLTARADDYERHDFSLRFPAVFSRFSPYASVAAGGNAQAASAWPSSTNPASAAWPHPELPYVNGVSPQFSTLRFAEGTQVYVTGEAAVLNAGTQGVFVPGPAQTFALSAAIEF